MSILKYEAKKEIYLQFCFVFTFIILLSSCNFKTMRYTEKQITFDNNGHFLNPTQVFSKNGEWIVYDTRNDGGQIGSTKNIEMINVNTGEKKELYETKNQTEYGPGVGAATFSPVADKVIFIHGIRNASEENPYGFTRRTGVAIDIDKPNQPIFMDARDIYAPFTAGALRGGTHAHSWSGDGEWLSYTYNDFVLEQLSKTNPEIQDLRVVGVMFPKKVSVKEDAGLENNSGEMFSAIVTKVTEAPEPGTDEIDKAFDEGWIGKNGYRKTDGTQQKRAIAFQGNVKDENGKTKTEVFVVDLLEDITQAKAGEFLEGTESTRPNVPVGVEQRRITFLKNGIEGPRHWLQSTSDGSLIVFFAKDDFGFINAFGVSPNGGEVKQLTSHKFDIQTGFNISPDGGFLAYGANNAVFITEISTGKSHPLTGISSNEEAPVNAINWSPDGKILVYNRYIKSSEGNYLQIFALKQDK